MIDLALESAPAEIVINWLKIWSRVFANDQGDQHSIPGRIIPKTQKMVFDAALLNTQYYKVRINGRMEQFRERSNALFYTSLNWKGSLWVAFDYGRQFYLLNLES